MTRYIDLDVLDSDGRREDMVLEIAQGQITNLRRRVPGDTGQSLAIKSKERALIAPGFIDLQVNGGGGWMLGDCDTVEDITALAHAHRSGGTVALLPTLITDTPKTTERVISLAAEAGESSPSILGLHLEGPHLQTAGAHRPDYLRPMSANDHALYRDAARALPHFMVTVAPEQVTLAQIEALAAEGAIVSLGHSPASYEAASEAYRAGATGATHLFNAMSGLGHRAPGLVGAALDHATWIGLIADGHHVHPCAMRLAHARRPDALYLTTDAMAVAGTATTGIELNGRHITRSEGRLTLADGTLAGADITMIESVQRLALATGVSVPDILPLGFDTPYRALTGEPRRLSIGGRADLIWLQANSLHAVHGPLGWETV